MFEYIRSHFRDYPRLEHANPKHKDILVVNWFMGNVCNYACSYCPKGLHDGSKSWVELDKVKRFVERVVAHHSSKQKFVFEFTGGEITLYKDFFPLMEFLKEKEIQVGIISNGSRSLDFWKKARPYLSQVCLSFHPESANADHFLDVARFLNEATRLHMNFMMHPKHFYTCYEVASKAKDIPNVSVALQPLIVDFQTNLYPYTPIQKSLLDKQRDLFSRHIKVTRPFDNYRGAMMSVARRGQAERRDSHRLVANGENSWKGWTCYAGLEQMVVNADGNIFRGWCEEGGAIGNVADENLMFPTKPVHCTRDSCHCNFDIMSTKIKAKRSTQ